MEFSRPKPSESDEDLLRLQDEFYKNKQGGQKRIKPLEEPENQEIAAKIEEQLSNTFESVPSFCIGDVKEQTPQEPSQRNTLPHPSTSRGFPNVTRITNTKSSGGGSLFSQQNRKRMKMNTDTPNSKTKEPTAGPSRSRATNDAIHTQSALDKKEWQEINEQNAQTIQQMTPEEIEEQRSHFINTLDPAIISFLKSRPRRRVGFEDPAPSPSIRDEPNVPLDEIRAPMELLNEASEKHWVNFSEVEIKKLAWMQSIKIPEDKKDQFEARFDFKGWLMEYTQREITEKNRILYHHGEEPERPGYTFKELFQLARSTVVSQRVIALSTVANILHLHTLGVYMNVLEIPVEQVFFVLRVCLDDNTPSVLQAAVRAMRNLIVYDLDEICLDSLFTSSSGMYQPVLSVDEDEFDYTVNDQELVEKNLIKCLVRTNIFTRMKYIFNTLRPEIEVIKNCLDILIRLARDSFFIVSEMCNSEGLLQSVVTNCIPDMGNSNQKPVAKAIKLFRVLASQRRSLAATLLNKYKIFYYVNVYLSDERLGAKLQTECFKLLTVVVKYKLEEVDYMSIHSLLLKFLHYHYNYTNIDRKESTVNHRHLAALLTLLASYGYLSEDIQKTVEFCCQKWLKQLSNSTEMRNLEVVTAALSIYSITPAPLISVDTISLISELIQSPYIRNMAENLKNFSMLLNNYETIKSSDNFITLETSAWNASEHVIPIMQSNSCFLFFCAISECLLHVQRVHLLNDFNNCVIRNYLELLQESSQFYLINNWFTRIEIRLILTHIKCLLSEPGHGISDDDKPLIYHLSVRMLPICSSEFQTEIMLIFKNVIFNKWFSPLISSQLLTGLLLEDLKLTEDDETNKKCDEINKKYDIYTRVLELSHPPCDIPASLSLHSNSASSTLVPVDWIYAPILFVQSKKGLLAENFIHDVILNCLEWIITCEQYFPLLVNSLTLTERYCRLAYTFLVHDSIFLTPDVNKLLHSCFTKILASPNEINFSSKIQGLSNFEDFYKQLIEQFQGVSYGDVLFGNFLLLPLQQRHNVQWRKTLWSEYLGAVRVLNLTEEQLLFPLETLLQPEEEDLSLIRCYGRALSYNLFLRKDSVMYKVAAHHLKCFMVKNKTT